MKFKHWGRGGSWHTQGTTLTTRTDALTKTKGITALYIPSEEQSESETAGETRHS